MQPTLEDRASRARCYLCGSPEVSALCHHCGKAMCNEHAPGVMNAEGKPVSMEFSGLGLAAEQSGGYHCKEHAHIVKGSLKKLIFIGIGVTVVGVITCFASLLAGLAVMAAGVLLAIAGYRADQNRSEAARAAQPPLPLIPNLDSISVRETLHGLVRLDENGGYTSKPDPVRGEFDVVMTLAKSDRDRLQAYRQKYGLADDAPVEFSAGFALIKGEAGLTMTPTPGGGITLLPACTGIWFRGDAASHPLFSRVSGRSGAQRTARIPYELQPGREPRSIPVWLVPSLVPASDQRTLEIDVHWAGLGARRRQLTLEQFEQIELVVPKEWGNVESVTPSAFISDPEDEIYRTITWKQPSAPPGQQGQSLTLAIRFEEQIKQVDLLRGRLLASFEGTLSGIKNVSFHRPLSGEWQKPPAPVVKTEVSVDFELSLTSIRYQDVRVVPDRNKDITNPAENMTPGEGGNLSERVYRPEAEEFPGVIPDYLTVIELTNEMSKSGYYIKRVTENQPGGGRRADLVSRVWDIAGRLYNGVFPVDFHITLDGEEEYRRGIRANTGSTSARIRVWGAYVDADMEKKIAGVWDTLHQKVKGKMTEQAAAVPSSGHQDGMGTSPPPMPAPAPSVPRSTGGDRATALRNRLESLTEALLAGKISEDVYQDIRADIKAELDDI